MCRAVMWACTTGFSVSYLIESVGVAVFSMWRSHVGGGCLASLARRDRPAFRKSGIGVVAARYCMCAGVFISCMLLQGCSCRLSFSCWPWLPRILGAQ